MKIDDLTYNIFFNEIYLIIANRDDHWECLDGNGEIEYIFDCRMNSLHFEVIS